MDERKRRCLLSTPVIVLILSAKLRDVSVPRQTSDIHVEPLIAFGDVPSRQLSPLIPVAIFVQRRHMRISGNSTYSVRVVPEVDALVHATLNLMERIWDWWFEGDGIVDNRLDRRTKESFLLELRLPRTLTAGSHWGLVLSLVT